MLNNTPLVTVNRFYRPKWQVVYSLNYCFIRREKFISPDHACFVAFEYYLWKIQATEFCSNHHKQHKVWLVVIWKGHGMGPNMHEIHLGINIIALYSLAFNQPVPLWKRGVKKNANLGISLPSSSLPKKNVIVFKQFENWGVFVSYSWLWYH